MKKYKRIGLINYAKDIVVREFSNGDKRYFRAQVCGWSNFKFSTETLTPMELLGKVITECVYMRAKIQENENVVEKLPSNYVFN